jgi:UDP-glucuronate decarboxylase
MKILVTGGAGFLGSHLCERLLAAGHDVTCLDDFSTGRRGNVRALAGPRFTLIEHDVRHPFDVPADRVYHLASPASPVHYQADETRTLLTNVLGTSHALDLALKHGARFLLASTSEVYGDPLEHPQPETYFGNVNPTGPRACYDEGKRAAETLAYAAQRQRGADLRVARIFNTYGPRMLAEDGRVVSTFIVQALRGEPLTVHGDGSHTRCFCYVDDLISGLVALMDSSTTDAPVNLGSDVEIPVRELAQQVLTLTGSVSKLDVRPTPADDPRRRKPDLSRARTLLGWRARTSLGDGLRKTIDWFRATAGFRPAPTARPCPPE